MDTTFDLFEGEETILTPKVIEPEVLAPKPETTITEYDSEDDMKKKAMQEAREALDR
jgi:hypothetical protein